MKIKGMIIVAAVFAFALILSSCEDPTDLIALEDGETYNYTGPQSSYYGFNSELEITNNIGSNIYSIFLQDYSTHSVIGNDLLGPNVIKRGYTNYIDGVPAYDDCEVRLTFSEDAVYDAVYSYGLSGEHFDFLTFDYYWINVSIDLYDSGRSISNPDPNTTVFTQDGIVVTITRRPR
ncbi:MAG: hypothetical protein JW881_13760 [Spirochaetales bacterium]|nr:hypothetical protein [Spirochaetales bacterium]